MARLERSINRHRLTWKFNMTKHYHCNDEEAMNRISDFINNHPLPFVDSIGGPQVAWFLHQLEQIFGIRYFPVLPPGPESLSAVLWYILDADARNRNRNWLICHPVQKMTK